MCIKHVHVQHKESDVLQQPHSVQELALLGIRQILFDRYVVDPGLHGRIEELNPVAVRVTRSYVEDQRLAEEQMLKAETCSHTPEVEQVPEIKNVKF